MIEPLSDRVLVEMVENSEFSKGGVYTGIATTTFVPDKDKIKQRTVGKVLAVGKGKYNKRMKRRPPDAPIGSIVCFSDTCGKTAEHDGKEYRFIREDDIIGFLDEPCTVEHVYRE